MPDGKKQIRPMPWWARARNWTQARWEEYERRRIELEAQPKKAVPTIGVPKKEEPKKEEKPAEVWGLRKVEPKPLIPTITKPKWQPAKAEQPIKPAEKPAAKRPAATPELLATAELPTEAGPAATEYGDLLRYYGYPEIDVNEYTKRLNAIMTLIEQDIPAEESKQTEEQKKTLLLHDQMYAQATAMAQLGGVTPDLPYYKEITLPFLRGKAKGRASEVKRIEDVAKVQAGNIKAQKEYAGKEVESWKTILKQAEGSGDQVLTSYLESKIADVDEGWALQRLQEKQQQEALRDFQFNWNRPVRDWQARIGQLEQQPRDWVTLWFARHEVPASVQSPEVEEMNLLKYKVIPESTGETTASAAKRLAELETQVQHEAQMRPSAPPTPGWLPKYLPGAQQGMAMPKTGVSTPTFTQWQSTPLEEKQRLAGYLDWAGGETIEQMEQRMYSMLPIRQPGRTQWRPARSRV